MGHPNPVKYQISYLKYRLWYWFRSRVLRRPVKMTEVTDLLLEIRRKLGYVFGWSDAQAGMTTGETVEVVAETIADVNALVSRHGVFRDDPTWDNFTQNIEEYRRYINSLEE